MVKSEKEQEQTTKTLETLLKVVDGNPPAHIADTKTLRLHLSSLKQKIDTSHMELAGCLQYAFDVAAFKDWGYATWKDYVEEEMEISVRKSEYLMKIWKWFSEVVKDARIRSQIEEIGWTKASLLVGVVDEDNANEWIKAAKNHNREELKQIVKNAKARAKGEPDTDKIEVFSNMTFRVTEEQKANIQSALELASQIADSEKPSHLLDLVCMSFVTDNRFQVAPGEKMLKHYLGKMESILGAKFIVIDPNTNDVVVGKQLLNKLVKETKN